MAPSHGCPRCLAGWMTATSRSPVVLCCHRWAQGARVGGLLSSFRPQGIGRRRACWLWAAGVALALDVPFCWPAPLALQEATTEACPSPTTACKDKLHRSFKLAKLQVGAAAAARAVGKGQPCSHLPGGGAPPFLPHANDHDGRRGVLPLSHPHHTTTITITFTSSTHIGAAPSP